MTPRAEVLRIAASMTVVSALGAAVLGGVYVATDRYQKAAALRSESRSISDLLGLDSSASVLEIRQFLEPGRDAVVYRARSLGAEGGLAKQLVFSLDGGLVSRAEAISEPETGRERLVPLGRLFLARRSGEPAGFVVEGTARGYKNRIRFLIGLTRDFSIAGVRVVEHQEDPGLGAEVATRPFEDQFAGRAADDLPALGVTRDPMPEDWRAALAQLSRTPPERWRARYAPLRERERARPIYAVTGATISSRALTDGVRSTVDHFRRRWSLLAPYWGGGT